MSRFLTSLLFVFGSFCNSQAESDVTALNTTVVFSVVEQIPGIEMPVKLSERDRANIENVFKAHLDELTLVAKKMSWSKSGDFTVVLPALGESVRADVVNALKKQNLLGKGYLTLNLVHPENAKLLLRLAQNPSAPVPPGYRLVKFIDSYDEEPTVEPLYIWKNHVLDSSFITHAQELYGPYEGKVSVELNKAGAEKMFQATKKMRHGSDRLAIILDGRVMSAPVVQSSLGKRFEISGLDTTAEAKKMAAALLAPSHKRLKVKSVNPPLAK